MKRFWFIAVAVACISAEYPTTFPFENESFVPVDIPAATPSNTYDPATDTGGYIYYYWGNTRPGFMLTEDMFTSPVAAPDHGGYAFAPALSGAIRYLLVNIAAAPPDLPAFIFNCTAKDTVVAAGDFAGIINGAKVCDTADCCSYIYGIPKFSDDQDTWTQTVSTRVAAGLCGDMMEEVYCILSGGDFQTNCIDQFISPSERQRIHICTDSYVRFLLTCKLFLEEYQPVYAVFEPPAYTDLCTMEQWMTTDAVYFAGDRICHPYSYYHPESAISEAAASDSSVNLSDESAASEAAASDFFIAASVLLIARCQR